MMLECPVRISYWVQQTPQLVDQPWNNKTFTIGDDMYLRNSAKNPCQTETVQQLNCLIDSSDLIIFILESSSMRWKIRPIFPVHNSSIYILQIYVMKVSVFFFRLKANQRIWPKDEYDPTHTRKLTQLCHAAAALLSYQQVWADTCRTFGNLFDSRYIWLQLWIICSRYSKAD